MLISYPSFILPDVTISYHKDIDENSFILLSGNFTDSPIMVSNYKSPFQSKNVMDIQHNRLPISFVCDVYTLDDDEIVELHKTSIMPLEYRLTLRYRDQKYNRIETTEFLLTEYLIAILSTTSNND